MTVLDRKVHVVHGDALVQHGLAAHHHADDPLGTRCRVILGLLYIYARALVQHALVLVILQHRAAVLLNERVQVVGVKADGHAFHQLTQLRELNLRNELLGALAIRLLVLLQANGERRVLRVFGDGQQLLNAGHTARHVRLHGNTAARCVKCV